MNSHQSWRVGNAKVMATISAIGAKEFVRLSIPPDKIATMLLATYWGHQRQIAADDGGTVRLEEITRAEIVEMCVYTDVEGQIIVTQGSIDRNHAGYVFHGHIDPQLYATTLCRRLFIDPCRIRV